MTDSELANRLAAVLDRAIADSTYLEVQACVTYEEREEVRVEREDTVAVLKEAIVRLRSLT